MRPNTNPNLIAADASISHFGVVIPADFVLRISAQAIVTGSSTGTLNIQASNDIAPPVDSTGHAAPVNWNNIPTVGTVAIAGAGTYLIPSFDVAYKWIRASYVFTNAQAGTISVNIQTIGN